MYIEIKTADGKTAWLNDRYVRCIFEQDGEWVVRTDDREFCIARKDNWGGVRCQNDISYIAMKGAKKP